MERVAGHCLLVGRWRRLRRGGQAPGPAPAMLRCVDRLVGATALTRLNRPGEAGNTTLAWSRTSAEFHWQCARTHALSLHSPPPTAPGPTKPWSAWVH